MTLRWYGAKFDTVTLKQIRQIPGVTGVITTLYDTEPGEVWSRERIRAMKEEVAEPVRYRKRKYPRCDQDRSAGKRAVHCQLHRDSGKSW